MQEECLDFAQYYYFY